MREHSKCLGWPEAKSNRFQGVVQMNFSFSCAITYRSGNLKGMYDGIKYAIGPMQSRIAPLKSATGDAIKDKFK